MYGRVFAGMHVVLVPEDERRKRDQAEVITDISGLAHFNDIRPGRYYVEATRLGFRTGPGSVVVQEHGSADPIEIDWPMLNMYESTTLAGQFQHLVVHSVLELAHPKTAPLSKSTLTLASIDSEKTIGTVVTDSEGRFAFPSLPQGFYLLRIKEKQPPDSMYPLDDYLVVLIKSDSSRTTLNLILGWSSCGMTARETP